MEKSTTYTEREFLCDVLTRYDAEKLLTSYCITEPIFWAIDRLLNSSEPVSSEQEDESDVKINAEYWIKQSRLDRVLYGYADEEWRCRIQKRFSDERAEIEYRQLSILELAKVLEIAIDEDKYELTISDANDPEEKMLVYYNSLSNEYEINV